MKTISKKKKQHLSPAQASRKERAAHAPDTISLPEKTQVVMVREDLIDFSPFNYRVYIDPVKLDELATEIKALGEIIQPVTARIAQEGRYQLVVGERRLRAGRIAGLPYIPVLVRDLTDAEVVERQLAENIQRADAHPMEEAIGIYNMQQVHKTIKEIAAHLGKSLTFVQGRLKLLSLNYDLREVYAAGHFTLTQALEVATLTTESQQSLFSMFFEGWKEKGSTHLPPFNSMLKVFRCELSQAPFDTKDKDLLPDRGACSRCPFNTATMKSLFPDTEQQAHCTDRTCYMRKSTAHLVRQITTAMGKYQPAALVFYGEPDPIARQAAEQAGAAELPTYNYGDIWLQGDYEKPDPDDYYIEDPESKEEYDHALAEYEQELEELREQATAGKLLCGLYFDDVEVKIVYFNPEKRTQRPSCYGEKPTTSAEVKAAIKAGTDTTEMLDGEIARIHNVEQREQKRDTEKIQESVHTAIKTQTKDTATPFTLTEADIAAGRWIIYETLCYGSREQFKKAVGWEMNAKGYKDSLLVRFHRLTPEQVCLLARLALQDREDSKTPGSEAAQLLYLMAQGAGIDTTAIEAQRKAAADQRRMRQESRLAPLRVRLETRKAKETA